MGFMECHKNVPKCTEGMSLGRSLVVMLLRLILVIYKIMYEYIVCKYVANNKFNPSLDSVVVAVVLYGFHASNRRVSHPVQHTGEGTWAGECPAHGVVQKLHFTFFIRQRPGLGMECHGHHPGHGWQALFVKFE